MKKSGFIHYVLGSLICLSAVVSSCKSTYYQKTDTYQASMITMNDLIKEDSVIANYITPFKQQLDAEMNRVIGRTAHALPRSPRDQSLGGNFFAETLLSLGQSIDSEVSCAVGTKDGIRTDLPEGPITVGHIFELMPFENYLTILTLKGTDMWILGEFIANTNGQPIAGMTVVIQEGKLVEMHINGESVQPEETYKLVTYDYLSNGGDNITGLSTPLQRVDTQILVREGLIAHIQSLTAHGQTIQSVIDERVKIIQ